VISWPTLEAKAEMEAKKLVKEVAIDFPVSDSAN